MSFKTKKIPEHLIIKPPTWDRPKKRGRWILWLIGPIVCLGILVFAVESMAEEIEKPGSGQLVFRNQSGIDKAALHVSSKLAIEISGIVAHMTFTQEFSNHTNLWQEGIYVFPLPETAGVNFMQIKIGERLIKAVVKEKDEARRIYKKAMANGQKAAMVEQLRPNLFTQKVSNIAPGETIIIEIRLIQHIDYVSGSFVLRFPTTITPRYTPQRTINRIRRDNSNEPKRNEAELDQLETFKSGCAFLNETAGSGCAFTYETTKVTDEHKTNIHYQDQLQNPIEISINLNSGLKLSQITSPYHKIKVERRDMHHKISLRKGTTSMDRDFILEWQPTENNLPQTAIFREHLEDDEYILLMVLPPNHQTENQYLPKEMIFIIDTSGSMGGESIRQAKASLSKAIQGLRRQDHFNIIEFNSLYSRLFYESHLANSHNKQLALSWVNRLTAGGGTEILPALRAALRPAQSNELLKQIIFITDGAVSNEMELFSLIHTKLNNAKLFTVGIGSAPNSYFMRKAAQFGGGTFTHIGDASEVHSKMNQLFEKLENPLVRDISITWDSSTESYPNRIPSLYLNEPLLVVAKTKNLKGSVKIHGLTTSKNWSQKLILDTHKSQPGIASLWARAKIDSLEDEKIAGRSAEEVRKEIVNIALKHQLVSQYTSLIAIEEIISRPPQLKLSNSQIPNLNPRGHGTIKLNYPKTATGGELSFWMGCLSIMLCFIWMSRRYSLKKQI